jgi:RNA polymerase-associated protein RTF1
MSESDSDSAPNADGDTEGPIFPLENKFYSEKDKAEIMALSEVQRESLLAERAQILERRAQDLRLRRMIQARDGAEAKLNDQNKRKAAAADLDDVHRKSSRQKTTLGGRKIGEQSGAIVELKRQREQKGLLDEQRKRDGEERKARKGNPDDGYSDADADGESEVEWGNNRAKATEPIKQDDQPASLIDFEHVRVGRDNFAKVCFYPGFDNAIKDCFARVSIGPDRATGENVYRVAQIKGVFSLPQRDT